MKKFFSLLTSLMVTASLTNAQDQPRSCTDKVAPFDEIMKAKVTSQVRTAHHYYLNSNDPGVGNTYEQRMANLQKEITRTFQAFMSARRKEYQKTVCNYYKTDWNQAGNSSRRTLTVQPGFYLLVNTLKRTTNGDWKGGPRWAPNESKPVSITWKTGGHRRSETFVDIQAMYDDVYIKSTVIKELNLARKELNDLGIPTELPPFLEE